MIDHTLARLTTLYLTWTAPPDETDQPAEDGFEIAQSMGIALLGLVVAAAFATALRALGVDVINKIRTEIGL